MKKIFVLMSLLLSMTFCVTSCSNTKTEKVEANDSTVVDTTLVDTTAVDSVKCLADTICTD